MNRIEEWVFGKCPEEEGDYLMCYGDVETPNNVFYVRLERNKDGAMADISDRDNKVLMDWDFSSYKFARLIYSPTDLDKYRNDFPSAFYR